MPSFVANITPSPGIAGVRPYSVPRHKAPIDLKLDANEGEAPSRELIGELLRIGPDIMRRYPSAAELQARLAAGLGVEPARVIVTAGADDALDRLCRAVLFPGRKLLLTNPSFEMLPRYARIAGAEVEEIAWMGGPFPVDEFLERLTPDVALIAVVTPNNPTGTVTDGETVRRLAEAAPHAIVLADLAYVEFADEDLTEFCLQFPNVVVARTTSKAWGLAGLRVGYAIGPEEYIGWMRAAGGPYAVSRPSLALALARLEADNGATERFVAQVREDRGRVNALMDELGIPRTESGANFVFVQTDRALWIRDALAGLGIAIRAFPDHPTLGNALRITCPGDREDCDRLTDALRAALAPEVVAFMVDALPAGMTPETFAPLAGRVRLLPVRDGEPAESLRGGRGWLLSASAKDMKAARRWGHVPLGLGSADLEPEGAARMIHDISQLEALLP